MALAPNAPTAVAQEGPSVLIVTAHPDDEAMFAATVYRITQHLGGVVDLALVTDGAGGYRFSLLAEALYGLKLTDPDIARQYLPAIRKQELMEGGRVVGLRNYFFMDQPDAGYTTNVDTVLQHMWNVDLVRDRLDEILARGGYDFIFTHLPIVPFHGHHKAATILALEAVGRMPEAARPVILGSFVSAADGEPPAFEVHPGYPVTAIRTDIPRFAFSRLTPMGEEDRLNYHIVVNWLIAAHKTQGTMQLFMNRGDHENFWLYTLNTPAGQARAEALFAKINAPGSDP